MAWLGNGGKCRGKGCGKMLRKDNISGYCRVCQHNRKKSGCRAAKKAAMRSPLLAQNIVCGPAEFLLSPERLARIEKYAKRAELGLPLFD